LKQNGDGVYGFVREEGRGEKRERWIKRKPEREREK